MFGLVRPRATVGAFAAFFLHAQLKFSLKNVLDSHLLPLGGGAMESLARANIAPSLMRLNRAKARDKLMCNCMMTTLAKR